MSKLKCDDSIILMHNYFDDDIDEYSHRELLAHLKECHSCNEHFKELKMTEQVLRQLPKKNVESTFVNKVLVKIPSSKRKENLGIWLKEHPVVVAASIFLFLFAVSTFSYMAPEKELRIVSGNQTNLIVQGNEVIVPEGQKVLGDLVIENGNLQINGEVKGNVTVVNGHILMANASQVDGSTKQVDQFFEWLWYQLKRVWYKM